MAQTWQTVRVFIEDYQRVRVSGAQSQEPSMAEWDNPLDYLRESNREQVDDIFEKLRLIDRTVHTVTGRDTALMTFAEDEIDTMAEMEYAS